MLKNVTLAALLTALPCSYAMAAPATPVNDHEEHHDDKKKDDKKKDKKGDHHDEHDDHHDDHTKPKH